ncbi:MAG: amidohydrolase family protein [Burkholderiales bacterium]|nr:amidohydrolase family protein [Burkholderiales bacterium]
MYDLIFRNARLLDGTGAAATTGDLAVLGGRIAEIGRFDGTARATIDADGLALMPGIIDNHTHYDAQVTWDASLAPSPALGVTTAVIGNCGFTIAPCRPADRELVMRNLTQVEGMSLDVLRRGIRWDFESVPEYLDMLERRGTAVNVAAFAGHSSLRTYVMGEDAPRRAATTAEVERMRELLAEAMRAGAAGFATSTSPAHNGEGGVPMPSRLASDDELRALVDVLGDCGRGVFMLTKGGHTRVDFLEDLAARTGRPVVIAALLHNKTNPQAVFDDLAAIDAANRRGRRLLGAVSCCPLTMDFTLHSPYPLEGLGAWQHVLGLKGDAFKAAIAAPAFREGLRAELRAPAKFRLFNGEWDQVQVVQAAQARHRPLEQKSIAALAREAGSDPLDCMLDLALAEDLDTVFTATLLNSDEDAVGRMLNHPHSLVSLSDAGAHLTFFNDAAFGLHLLGHWSRDLGKMPLEEAVRRLTGQPAAVFGFADRGLLKRGHAADLLLFDPATVGRGAKRRVHDLPGGAGRLHTDAVGVHGVWVNGVEVADSTGLRAGQPRPGRLLRGGAG